MELPLWVILFQLESPRPLLILFIRRSESFHLEISDFPRHVSSEDIVYPRLELQTTCGIYTSQPSLGSSMRMTRGNYLLSPPPANLETSLVVLLAKVASVEQGSQIARN